MVIFQEEVSSQTSSSVKKTETLNQPGPYHINKYLWGTHLVPSTVGGAEGIMMNT